jgi:hypothetical protein
MGGIFSSSASSPPVILFVRVKEEGQPSPAEIEADFVNSKHVKPGQRVIEMEVAR